MPDKTEAEVATLDERLQQIGKRLEQIRRGEDLPKVPVYSSVGDHFSVVLEAPLKKTDKS
jgi:hypothetical protein